MKKLSIFCGFVVLSMNSIQAQTQDLYDRNVVQTIEIFFASSSWDSQMDALASTTEDYLLADSVRINGVVYDSVGVKYKGNSSYNANNNKNPLHINLDWVNSNHDYQGYTEIKLQNGYQDPSMIREVLSYAILEQYMDCPRANFANVYINGTLRGVYSNAQSIDDRFNGDHYYSADGSFFKCNPIGGAGPGATVSPDLKWISSDSTGYYNGYELKSDFGWTKLVALIDTLNNNFTQIESNLDVDRALWMLAFNNVLVNLDSYSGAFKQNYYLYEDLNDRFVPTVWDLNMSFGGFPGGTGAGPLTTPSALDPMSNSSSTGHPLILKMLGNPLYKRMYMAHLRTIVQEVFASGDYVTTATALQNTIDASVLADPYKFFTYAQFQGGLTQNVTISGGMGSTTLYGIQNLMGARVTYFSTNTNYILVAPTINNYAASNATPVYGETIWITADCSNESIVYLGYRYQHPLKFTRVQMFDDGAHGDGAAGDHVYGAAVTMNCSQLEYYIYTENANAGLFSPQRAEHEFHTLMVNAPAPVYGDIIINELLADNSLIDDFNGESNDWIEIYNTTSTALNLSGMYLTDDLLNLVKWQFPAGSVIAPNEYLIVWADNDTLQYGYHANFKLGMNGETLTLSNGSTIFDQVTFPVQTTDVAYARCPDEGTFTFSTTTFAAPNNCYLAIDENQMPLNVSLYPNPTSENLYLSSNEEGALTFSVIDIQGRILYTATSSDKLIQIPTAEWQSGYYRMIIQSEIGKTTNVAFIKQ